MSLNATVCLSKRVATDTQCTSDQESYIITMFEDALKIAGKTGKSCDPNDPTVMQAVPEHSAVGASPSNGRDERAVQAFEDLLKCYKSAL